MADDYTPTTGEVREQFARGARGTHGGSAESAAYRHANEQNRFDRWLTAMLAAHDAAKRAEWEAEQGETLRQVEKFLVDAEEVGRITDPAEQFGTLTEKAAGGVDRAWRQGLRRILGPIPDTGAES